MAGYRQIHTQIWKDDWVIELDPTEKLFFIYLFSNDLASISGLYKIPVRAMVNETGIPKDKIESMLAKFQADGKVFYGDNTLFIKNMMRYHQNASPKTKEKIRKDVASVPDCEIKRIAMQYLYGMDTISNKKNGVSILGSESESVSENLIVNKSEILNKSINGSSELSEIQKLSSIIENNIGIINGNISPEEYISILRELVKAGAIESDVISAKEFMQSKGRTIYNIRSLVGPIKTAISKRRNPPKENVSGDMIFDEDLQKRVLS